MMLIPLCYSTQDAPHYRPGMWACIACALMNLLLVGIIGISFWRDNSKQARGEKMIESNDVSLHLSISFTVVVLTAHRLTLTTRTSATPTKRLVSFVHCAAEGCLECRKDYMCHEYNDSRSILPGSIVLIVLYTVSRVLRIDSYVPEYELVPCIPHPRRKDA